MHHPAVEIICFREQWLYAIFMKCICIHTEVSMDTVAYIMVSRKIMGTDSGLKESDLGLTETIWHRFRGSK